ncbi:hypothetical protein CO731_01670 [Aminobacter sp. MSH1]|nr:hypothetical protein CO731_01670 [Aminobacter sp. MSH1]
MTFRSDRFGKGSGQLNLFGSMERPRSADLSVFPASKMRGSIRDAAGEILALPLSSQKAKLHTEIGLLRLRLQRMGISPTIVVREVEAYKSGIEGEMRRQIIMTILRDERGGAA